MKIKQIQNDMIKQYFGGNFRMKLEYQRLQQLYHLHHIVYTFFCEDSSRERLLKAIKKEQKLIEDKEW